MLTVDRLFISNSMSVLGLVFVFVISDYILCMDWIFWGVLKGNHTLLRKSRVVVLVLMCITIRLNVT